MLFHVLDMLGPEIDKGHVLAGLDHMRAGIAADRARAHHRNLLARRHHLSSNRSGPRSALLSAGAPQSPGAILVRGGAAGKAMAEIVIFAGRTAAFAARRPPSRAGGAVPACRPPGDRAGPSPHAGRRARDRPLPPRTA